MAPFAPGSAAGRYFIGSFGLTQFSGPLFSAFCCPPAEAGENKGPGRALNVHTPDPSLYCHSAPAIPNVF